MPGGFDVLASLDAVLDSDVARGRWTEVALPRGPVRLRLGREPGTGAVEVRMTPVDWGADALVARVAVLCRVMQAYTLTRLG